MKKLKQILTTLKEVLIPELDVLLEEEPKSSDEIYETFDTVDAITFKPDIERNKKSIIVGAVTAITLTTISAAVIGLVKRNKNK